MRVGKFGVQQFWRHLFLSSKRAAAQWDPPAPN
jgi:hypothetical protein